MTRYQHLRQAIARLAAPAEEQDAWLRQLLGHLDASGREGEAYGNDELALEFDDFFHAAGTMRENGEITQDEIDAAHVLNDLLLKRSGNDGSGFWTRPALWNDERWEEIRACARQVLVAFPDEERLKPGAMFVASGAIRAGGNGDQSSPLRALGRWWSALFKP
jgi:hypothetical protein